MTTPDAAEDRLAVLEERLRVLEDELAINRLLTSYGPFVDGGEADAVAGQWTEEGVYDVDERYMAGREQLGAMVRSKAHQGYIAAGCAHFLGPAHVTLHGDSAVAVCHSLMVVNGGGEFGTDAAFAVRRATAHHFELVRTDEGWRVTRRTSRVLDGRPEAPALLVRGVRGLPA